MLYATHIIETALIAIAKNMILRLSKFPNLYEYDLYNFLLNFLTGIPAEVGASSRICINTPNKKQDTEKISKGKKPK